MCIAGMGGIWVRQLLMRADYMDALISMNTSEAFGTITKKLTEEDLLKYEETLDATGKMHSVRRNYIFAEATNGINAAMSTRYNTWYNEIWTPDKLLGATTTCEDTMLRVSVNGTAMDYRWYIRNT